MLPTVLPNQYSIAATAVFRSGLHAPTGICVGHEGGDNFDPDVRVCAAGEFLSDHPSHVNVPEVACAPVRPVADACEVPAPNTEMAGDLRVQDVAVAAECRVPAGASLQCSDAPTTKTSIVDPQGKVPAAVSHDALQFDCQKFDLGGARAFCLEIFGGSCRLTRTLRSAGFNAWAVDYMQNKLQPESPAYLRLDLCLADHKRTFWRLLQHPRLLYVHFAPPCGTCSRARKVPIKDAKCPPVPLRSRAPPSRSTWTTATKSATVHARTACKRAL